MAVEVEGLGAVVEGGEEGGGGSKGWDGDGEWDSRAGKGEGEEWVLYRLWEWVHGNVVLALLGGKERMSRRARGPADIKCNRPSYHSFRVTSSLASITDRSRLTPSSHSIYSPPPPPPTLQILTITNFSHPAFSPLPPTISASHTPPPSQPLTPAITSCGLFCAHNNRNALPL